MTIRWQNCDAATQAARNRKAKELRTCRHYLANAKARGYSEKSTTVRKWEQLLAEWRAEPIWEIAKWRAASDSRLSTSLTEKGIL